MRFPFYLRNRLLRNNILPQYSNILQVERNMKYSFANGMLLELIRNSYYPLCNKTLKTIDTYVPIYL